ncbi:MAG TPA: BrnT family toxin [Anaerolineales bacterium]|nr:BrnT family toxin [Anaerolineales bacterium]
MINLDRLSGFEWDQGNREKNWEKHRVASGECEEVFFNLPLLLKDDSGHSQSEPRFLVLGQTNAGQHLFIAFTVRKEKIRVISARDMNQKEKNSYEQTNS